MALYDALKKRQAMPTPGAVSRTTLSTPATTTTPAAPAAPKVTAGPPKATNSSALSAAVKQYTTTQGATTPTVGLPTKFSKTPTPSATTPIAGATALATKATGAATASANAGYSVDDQGNIFWSNPDAYQDPAQQIAAANAASQKKQQYAQQMMQQQMALNAQEMDSQLSKLRGQQAVDNQGAQELQNRRGGFYSGGLDYQTGAIGSAYAEQRGALAQSYQQRNLTLQQQYGDQLNQIAQNLSQANIDTIKLKIEQAAQAKQDALNAENLALSQAQITGQYVSPRMQELYNAVNKAKQDYANATTPEQRASAHQAAEMARAELATLGANTLAVGSNVTLGQSAGSTSQYGVQTQAAKEFDATLGFNKERAAVEDAKWTEEYGLNKTQVMAALTGYMPDGSKTTTQEQADLQALWTVADYLGTIPDELAEKYGFPKGTETMAAKEFALQKWQAEDNSSRYWDENARQWVETDLASQPEASEYDGVTANQVYSAAADQFKDEDGKIPTDPATKEAIYKQVGASGLPTGQDDQVMTMLGLTQEEIAAFDKKYGVTTGK